MTHRAVAGQANLPLASTTYYFESIDQLTEEALRLHVAERVEELQRLRDAASEHAANGIEVARRFAEDLTQRDAKALVAQFEVYLEAARDPALRSTVADALEAFEQLAAGVLRSLGAGDPEGGAAALVALADGVALHRVARPGGRHQDADTLLRAMQGIFMSYTMSDAEITDWYLGVEVGRQ